MHVYDKATSWAYHLEAIGKLPRVMKRMSHSLSLYEADIIIEVGVEMPKKVKLIEETAIMLTNRMSILR